jgi:ribonuclease HII
MGYLIGTDEAGYGPNLGPLVISATLWEVPDGVRGEGLFEHLQHLITPSHDRGKGREDNRVLMADSKLLYTPSKGLHRLELGLGAAMNVLGHRPGTWHEVWQALSPEALDAMPSIPWYVGYDAPVPFDCTASQIEPLGDKLRVGLPEAGVRLMAVRSRVIFAEEFNALVEQHGNKGAALSSQTLALAARLIAPLPSASIEVICDKHGGRNRYGQLLSEHFSEWLIEVRGEGRERSVYQFGPADRRIEFCFRTKAETCLPAALASMASKYLRELAMHAFNAFWQERVPNLQPTAGYPEDAKRFRADIAETQQELHISDRILWRIK